MNAKKIIFFLLCIFTAGLIIYIAVTSGAQARELAEYEEALAQIENGSPEQRVGSLYFNRLSRRVQYLYDAIYKAATDGEDSTAIIPFLITGDELDGAVSAVAFDCPELFYIDWEGFTLEDYVYEKKQKGDETPETVVVTVYRDNKYSVLRIPYTEKDTATEKADELTDTLITRLNAALKKADVKCKDVQDPFLQVRLIHDYLTDICSHYSEEAETVSPPETTEVTTEAGTPDAGTTAADTSAAETEAAQRVRYASTAYGALVNGQADSIGYAKAFKLLWARYGGISYTVSGRADGVISSWNVALVSDKYYNIDVYSDDLDSVINGKTVHGASCHLWLLCNDESFYSSHSDKPDGVPACTETENFYTMNALLAGNGLELERIVSSAVKTCSSSHSRCFELYYASADAENEISAYVTSALSQGDYSDFANAFELFRVRQDANVYIVYLYVRTPDNG